MSLCAFAGFKEKNKKKLAEGTILVLYLILRRGMAQASSTTIVAHTERFVKDTLKNIDASHDWYHIERVRTLALTIVRITILERSSFWTSLIIHLVGRQKRRGWLVRSVTLTLKSLSSLHCCTMWGTGNMLPKIPQPQQKQQYRWSNCSLINLLTSLFDLIALICAKQSFLEEHHYPASKIQTILR